MRAIGAKEAFMQKTKILLLTHNLWLTGAPKLILEVFEKLKDEFDVRILAGDGGELQERYQNLGKLKVLSQLPPRGVFVNQVIRKITVLWENLTLLAWWLFWKPDLVYANSAASLTIPGWIRLPIVPVILHVHEMQSELAKADKASHDVFRKWPDRYIAVSQAVRTQLTEHFKIEDKKISVIHAFIPAVNPNSQQLASSKDEARFVVGGAGFPGWIKGIVLWLQMAVELKKRLGENAVRFVWVGIPEREEGRNFKIIAQKLGIDSSIEFVPITNEPFKYFNAMDVFATTSWEDSCPLVVLENMMHKKPVICFAGSGGAQEEIGSAGVVVEDFSPIAMADTIEKLAKDPNRRKSLGEAAYQRVRKHFVDIIQIPKIRAVIYDLLQKPNFVKPEVAEEFSHDHPAYELVGDVRSQYTES